MTDQRGRAGGLWAIVEWIAMILGLGALAVLCLLWMPFALLLNPLLPADRGRALGRLAIRLGLRAYLGFLQAVCGCRFDLRDLDRLRDAGPLIVAANHPSLLDAVMIVSRLPNAVCIMKASLMNNILFGAAARLARYIRNHPPLEMILESRTALQQGAQLVIFPEGSRTLHFPLDACQPTVGLIASRAQVPVQTLLIEFSTPYLGKAWPLFQRPSLPLRARVRLGRQFPPPVDADQFAQTLAQYFRSELPDLEASTAHA